MKLLVVVSSAEIGFWLAELTHPYWHFSERGIEMDIASPKGGKAVWDKSSDPYSEGTWEPEDIISKGFLSDPKLVARLETTIALKDVVADNYDAIHIVGGGGAAVDLFPNNDIRRILEHFWTKDKIIGAICHGSIALANNPDRVKGRKATGFSRDEDAEVEKVYGANFIPNFPEPVMVKAGIKFFKTAPWSPRVIVDRKLVTGQNQQSASEYAVALTHVLLGSSPVLTADEAVAAG